MKKELLITEGMGKESFSLLTKNFYHGKNPVTVSPSFNLALFDLTTIAVPLFDIGDPI